MKKMNEKLQKLIGDSLDYAVPETWIYLDQTQLVRFAEKLSEMIIKDCINLKETVKVTGTHSNEYEQGVWDGIQLFADEIKKTFGVKP